MKTTARLSTAGPPQGANAPQGAGSARSDDRGGPYLSHVLAQARGYEELMTTKFLESLDA